MKVWVLESSYGMIYGVYDNELVAMQSQEIYREKDDSCETYMFEVHSKPAKLEQVYLSLIDLVTGAIEHPRIWHGLNDDELKIVQDGKIYGKIEHFAIVFGMKLYGCLRLSQKEADDQCNKFRKGFYEKQPGNNTDRITGA